MSHSPADNPYSAPQSSDVRKPRRVKYLGLFWITGRTYCILQTGGLVLGLIALALWFWMPVSPTWAGTTVYKYLPWGIIVALFAELIEAAIMWRKFQTSEDPA
ncbi:MAG: hypothetical protein MPJ50_07520 [Pirellulales bacterium]|nr:hypothetical protein [Pirellulales bacterium]